ncbi:hypothetical protein [Streptomyces sp. NRRL S-1448]|uniref:hypothetical protein n=1 Tax=Streptomyces sp. NRRL S-1448 TaxID=1463883 RepID=UPI0004BF0054|nr:hypothetical protein [Streptomyces sp. NRRL S-1448]
MKRGGPARWNDETQSWEDGRPAPAPYSGPMPPRPDVAPSVGPPPQPPSGWLPDPGARPGDAPAPGPVPGSGPRRRTTVALIAGAAVAAIGAGAGGAYLLWGRDSDAPPAARTRASAPHTPTSTATDTTPPSTASTPPTDAVSSSAVPAGYRLVHDAKGFTTAVPDSWQRSERKTGVFYTAPDDRGLLQIFEITEPDIGPRAALEQASKGLAGNPGYEEISLGDFEGPAPGTDAAQLVYAYDSERLGTRVKVVDCAFTTDDGRQFAVLVLGTEADWPLQQETQRIALQAFAPRS